MITLLRYVPRLLIDYLITRGAAMLIVGLVFMLPILASAGELQGADQFDARAVLLEGLRNTGPFLILVALYGVIGQDFRQGFYRFLFVRPVSPVGYYVASFVIALTGFMLVELVMTGLYALAVEPVWPGLMLLDAATYFVFLGSLIFALSRFSRLDWLLAMFLVILGDLLRDAYPKDASWIGAVLHVLLPPDAPTRIFDTVNVAWSEVTWILGYAAIALSIGLASVRFVPMGSAR